MSSPNKQETETGETERSTLAVAQIVTTLARGGAQATVMASLDMAEHDVSVTVLSGPDVTDEGSFWEDGVSRTSLVVQVPHLVRRLSPLKDLLALIWMIRWLQSNRPDVVHTHSSKAGVLGRVAAFAAGIPCAHTIHGWGPLYSSRLWVRVGAIAVERLMARLTATLVVVGGRDLHRGLTSHIGTAEQYRVIRSGVDTSLAATASRARDSIRRDLGVADRFVVGMVARMAFPKDHANLVAAFQQADIPNSILVLIGDGPQRSEVERVVAKAGIEDRVQVLGLRSDAARVVAAFDVAMLSSRWEGMPRSVVEAAAAGVPVVATDVGSVGDLIEDGVTGRLVPPRDVTAMASALHLAYTEPSVSRVMADRAVIKARQFSVQRMRTELRDLWSEMAGISMVRAEVVPEMGSTVDGDDPGRSAEPVWSRTDRSAVRSRSKARSWFRSKDSGTV